MFGVNFLVDIIFMVTKASISAGMTFFRLP